MLVVVSFCPRPLLLDKCAELVFIKEQLGHLDIAIASEQARIWMDVEE